MANLQFCYARTHGMVTAWQWLAVSKGFLGPRQDLGVTRLLLLRTSFKAHQRDSAGLSACMRKWARYMGVIGQFLVGWKAPPVQ